MPDLGSNTGQVKPSKEDAQVDEMVTWDLS